MKQDPKQLALEALADEARRVSYLTMHTVERMLNRLILATLYAMREGASMDELAEAVHQATDNEKHRRALMKLVASVDTAVEWAVRAEEN